MFEAIFFVGIEYSGTFAAIVGVEFSIQSLLIAGGKVGLLVCGIRFF